MDSKQGSSFDEHFKSKFSDPEFGWAIYELVEADFMAAQETIEELRHKLLIESTENARLQAVIKRRGY